MTNPDPCQKCGAQGMTPWCNGMTGRTCQFCRYFEDHLSILNYFVDCINIGPSPERKA